MKLGRTTKFGRIFWCLRLIHHSRYPFSSLHGSTRLTYPYPHRSRLSFLFSPIDHLRLNPSSKFLSIRSCALRVLYVFLLFILPPRLVASTFCPRQYHSSFLALLGVPCIQCSRWV